MEASLCTLKARHETSPRIMRSKNAPGDDQQRRIEELRRKCATLIEMAEEVRREIDSLRRPPRGTPRSAPAPDRLPVRDVARQLGVPPDKVRRYINAGTMLAMKERDGTWSIPESEVRRFRDGR